MPIKIILNKGEIERVGRMGGENDVGLANQNKRVIGVEKRVGYFWVHLWTALKTATTTIVESKHLE